MDNPNIDNADTVKNPSPFITFTARTIPATFDTSMSYQEALFALVNYLQTQVTPAINENAQITNEQTKAINELYDFVNHYFDNLDVQEEINNKLDEMAESGELAEAIAQFLNLGAVFGFDNIEDMTEVTYLINGSICKVLGKTNPLTGDGSYYRVRERLNSDEPDGINIVVLPNTANLIAEIIPDFHYDKLNAENANHMMVFDTLDDAESADIPEGRTFCTNGKEEVNDGEGATYIKGSSINTIINDVQENYYDEIYYETLYVANVHTNYYLTYIPKLDKNGDMIELYQGSTADYQNKPSKYAKANYTSVTFNFSCTYLIDTTWYLPSMIVNGEIVTNTPYENPQPFYYYLAMFADRSWVIYPATTSMETMLNAGAIQATLCFGQCVTNGEVTYTESGDRNNRQLLGVKPNGDIILFTSDYGNGNWGFTVTEASNILINKGCTNVFQLDGGGSTSTTVKGYKINLNKDDNGRTERSIQYTLNAKKPTLNKNIGKAYNDAGNVAESLRISQLDTMPFEPIHIGNQSINSLDTKVYGIYYCDGSVTNLPQNKAGYLINIPRTVSTNTPYSNGDCYQELHRVYDGVSYYRVKFNGTWSHWFLRATGTDIGS